MDDNFREEELLGAGEPSENLDDDLTEDESEDFEPEEEF